MRKHFKLITVISVIATILVNIAATSLPLNGISTAAVSDKYFTLFTPAGYVFAIWGVIYIGLLVYAFYPFTIKKSDWLLPAFPWFVLAAIANMTWLFLWHAQQLGWSVAVMLVLLVSLIMVYIKLEIGVYKASALTSWMVHIPVSIYLGWISVATIANISAALVQVKWGGFGIDPVNWAIVMVLAAAILATLMLIIRTDFAYATVIVWALIGIALNAGKVQASLSMAITLAIGAIVVIATAVLFDKVTNKR